MSEPTKEAIGAPENPFNRAVIDSLTTVHQALSHRSKSPLLVDGNGVSLMSGGEPLARITPGNLVVAGESFQRRIATEPNAVPEMRGDFGAFLNELGEGLKSLNHLGISYYVPDIEQEHEAIRHISEEAGIESHEEPGAPEDQEWLFLGHVDDWRSPLFEMVLNKGVPDPKDFWRPHFQIDLDTHLPWEQLKDLTDKHFGPDFFKWTLDIPNVGPVLGMGVIGNVGGSKIALGLGPVKRSPEAHRRQLQSH